jgi:MFS transporter, DHA2 family, multidrug resistance protein
MLQQAFMARGMDAVTAKAAAIRAIAGTATAQSVVLSFDHIFLLAGGLFLLVLPLLYFLRMPKQEKPAAAELHVEM